MADPTLIGWSREVAETIGLPTEPGADQAGELAQVLSGNRLVEGMAPYAARYGGHQFGNWAGQLGDGRAIALGEVAATDGTTQTLQLKGPGLTPYSRTADGRAVLRSSVREFLCSEAMFHLGVPTTRALSLVTTGDAVVRDMFYDGNPAPEPGAVVCRVAPSFLRLGSFELPELPNPPGGADYWPAVPPHAGLRDELVAYNRWLCDLGAQHPQLLPFLAANPAVMTSACTSTMFMPASRWSTWK